MTFQIETYDLIPDSALSVKQQENLINKGFTVEQVNLVNGQSFYDFLINNLSAFKYNLFDFEEVEQLSYYGRELYAKVKENQYLENMKSLFKSFEKIEDEKELISFVNELIQSKQNGPFYDLAELILKAMDLQSQMKLLLKDEVSENADILDRLQDQSKLDEYNDIINASEEIESGFQKLSFRISGFKNFDIEGRDGNIKNLSFAQILEVKDYYPYKALTELRLNYDDALKIKDYETSSVIENHLRKLTSYGLYKADHKGINLDTLMEMKTAHQYEIYKFSNNDLQAPEYLKGLSLEQAKSFSTDKQVFGVTNFHLEVEKALLIDKDTVNYLWGSDSKSYFAIMKCLHVGGGDIVTDFHLNEEKVKALNNLSLEDFTSISDVNQCLKLIGDNDAEL